MQKRILLYGATGYSGRLIADQAQRTFPAAGTSSPIEFVLGGRDRRALEQMSDELALDHLVFALDDQGVVNRALADFDAVINAAGPFARTAVRLAKSAVAARCHYIDINGEIDVYQTLDDLARPASHRGVRLVSAAGYTSTVSDVLLHWAISALRKSGWEDAPLGTLRFATSAITHFSRGSILTMLRSVREQVTMIRDGCAVHVPVGRFDRAFDFGSPLPGTNPSTSPSSSSTSSRRIASAANLLDTLTAAVTVRQLRLKVGSIESYVDMSTAGRIGYQLGAWSAVLLQLPLVQTIGRAQIAQLPEGPDAEERQRSRPVMVLQIESPYRELHVDWRLETPNSYDVTARCVLAVAGKAVEDGAVQYGWITPGEVLNLPPAIESLRTDGPVRLTVAPFQECELDGRPVSALDTRSRHRARAGAGQEG
jgi:short subunit dehydrogenase-like uncharacterized protein